MHSTLIYCGAGYPSVFESQVVAYLNYLRDKEYFKEVVFFWGVKNLSQLKKIKKAGLHPRIKIICFRLIPNYYGFNFAQRILILIALKKIKDKLFESVFHVRGEMIAFHLHKLIKPFKSDFKLLCDIRGVSEEISEYSSSFSPLKFLKKLNYDLAMKSCREILTISTVSKSLKNYLVEKYKFDQSQVVITPCLASENFVFSEDARIEIRDELGIGRDEIVLIFSSGGDAAWQNFSSLEIIAKMNFKLLNLSKKKITAQNVLNVFVPYSEVPKYLSAADYGFLWRKESIVNKVASPVKFSEYVCCGLPTISNSNVDTISDFILVNSDSGYLFEKIENLKSAKLQKKLVAERFKLAKTGSEVFGIKVIAQKYFRIYEVVSSEYGKRGLGK